MKSRKSLNVHGKNKISGKSKDETSVTQSAGTGRTGDGSNSRHIKKTSAGSTRRAKSVRTVTRIIIGLALLVVLLSGSSLSSVHTGRVAGVVNTVYLSRGPIQINGNTGFTAPNSGVTGGSGTAADPFIIQGWDINLAPSLLTGGIAAGIFIVGTTASFVVRNVYVHDGINPSATIGLPEPCFASSNGIPGILLEDVTNGLIENSISNQNAVGIYVDRSVGNIVTNNDLTANECGFYLSSSSSNTITFNTAYSASTALTYLSGEGFSLNSSSRNTVSYNKAIDAGIGFEVVGGYFGRSSGNTLDFNIASNCELDGFYLFATSGDTLRSNTATNTNQGYGFHLQGIPGIITQQGTIPGVPTTEEILYKNKASNNYFAGFLSDLDSGGNLLVSNTASGSQFAGQLLSMGTGFGFFHSNSSRIISNQAYNNGAGFALSVSSRNQFISNTSHHNGDGFDLEIGSDLNVFELNQVYGNNGNAGINIDPNVSSSSSETFAYNSVYDNTNGFEASQSTNDTLLGNQIFGNTLPLRSGAAQAGIFLQGVSKANITRNIIFNNPTGIWDQPTGTGNAGGDMIYDNFFSNILNANQYHCNTLGTCLSNDWNVTKRPGTNILGGSFIGGNFWSDYLGSDLDADGLGDTPYSVPTCVSGLCIVYPGLGTDFLPIMPPLGGTNPDFAIFGPSFITLSQGGNGTALVALTSLGNLVGTASLTPKISPSLPGAPVVAIEPSFVSLTSGITSAASVNVTKAVVPGSYSLTVTAAVGQTTHAITMSLVVFSPPIFSVVRSLNNEVYSSIFSSSWSSWQWLSGETVSSPVVCSSAFGIVDLVVRGADNSSIWHKSYSNGAWSTWDSPGSLTNDQPACGSIGDLFHLVIRGTDNQLWSNTRNDTSGLWTGWQSLGGIAAGPPILAVSPSLNRLDLIVQGTGGALWHKTFLNGAWSQVWDTPGGSTPTTPSAASDGQVLHLVVRGADNALWYNSLNFTTGSWSNWFSLRGATGLNPALSVDPAGNVHLVVVGTDGSLWHMMKLAGGPWFTTWDHLGGITTNSPALAFIGSTGVVIVRGVDGSVWYNMLAGSAWIGWAPMGGIITGNPQLGTLS